MMLNMIAGLRTNVLTSVALAMNTLVKRRSVDSGMLFFVIIFTSLTPSQRWTFRTTCVRQGFSM